MREAWTGEGACVGLLRLSFDRADVLQILMHPLARMHLQALLKQAGAGSSLADLITSALATDNDVSGATAAIEGGLAA